MGEYSIGKGEALEKCELLGEAYSERIELLGLQVKVKFWATDRTRIEDGFVFRAVRISFAARNPVAIAPWTVA